MSRPVLPRTRPAASRLALATALVTAVLAAGCDAGATAAAAPPATLVSVGTATVRAEPLTLTTELPGRTSSPLVAEIRPQVSGLVTARRFIEGAAVKAGQVLYQIDAASYRATLASADAEVAKADATLAAARLTAERQAELLKIDATSRQDAQDAQAAVQQALADLQAARAARSTAQLDLSHATVTSPIAGLVDVSSVTTGALVTANQTTALTTVRQIDPIQVDVSQSSAELLQLKRALASGALGGLGDQAATVRLLLEDGSTYARTGTLRFSGAAVNPSTGAVTLRAVFPNPDGLLLPGMYVRAVLQTGVAEQALLVPMQAVSRDAQGQASVLVVDARSQITRRVVTVDRAVGNRWLVSDGLKDGEEVVVEGAQKVKPGDTVQAYASEPTAARAG